jgi:Tfp pilus assembly protein PilO
MPIILIGISIALFFTITNPLYYGDQGITALNAQIASYNQALDTSKELQNEKDQLTNTYNKINPDDLAKLQKLLPDNVNNIRLILEIEQIAAPYGMILSDVKYDTTSNTTTTATNTTTATVVVGGNTTTSPESQDYGTFNLEFSVSGSYDNFMNFTKDLQNNLRIVDISSISFSSDTGTSTTGGTKTNAQNTYKYDFKIKTYWLKS